ncbi:MAG: hypothetical protein K8R56_07570 [Candidatus Eisenbacteria bacterium]|nr:hypothetical protein [Candidatus Eisenbacteria bacterium]
MTIDTSIRAAGMGGASAGVSWGDAATWGNPASLSGVNGLRWVMTHTRVLPEFSNDLVFQSQELQLGAAGIGLSLSGKPIEGLGSAEWSLVNSGIDPFGGANPDIGEHVESYAIGIAPLAMAQALHLLGADAIARDLHVAFGLHHRESHYEVGSSTVLEPTRSTDWGAQLRLRLAQRAGTRLELGAGYARLGNAPHQPVGGIPFFIPGDETRIRRIGVALRVTQDQDESAPLRGWPFHSRRTLEWALAYDNESWTDEFESSAPRNLFGTEMTLLDLVSVRAGYVVDGDGDFDGPTIGAGLRLPIASIATLGGDWGTWPGGNGIDTRHRFGVSLGMDVLAAVQHH